MNHLSRFESVAKQLIEGAFGRMLGKDPMPSDIALHLAQAVEYGQRDGVAPDFYLVRLHPDDKSLVQNKYPDLEQELTEYVLQLVRESEISTGADVSVRIEADASTERRQVVIESIHSETDGKFTQVNHSDRNRLELSALRALDSFVIVNGKKHVPLDRPVIRVGRQIDNDIVIEAPTVSRQHAQIRWRYGRFVIFDLGSRSGTSVNGQPVSERVLDPGDVISLSNITLIYGEGVAESRQSQPQPYDDGDTTLAFHADDRE